MQVYSVTRGVLKAVSAIFSMCSGTLEVLSLVPTETFLPSLQPPPLLLITLVEGPYIFLDVTQGTDKGVEIGVGIGIEIGGDVVQDLEVEGNLVLLSLVERDGDRSVIHDQGVGHGLHQNGENQNHGNPEESIRKGAIDLDLGLCQVQVQLVAEAVEKVNTRETVV